MKILIVPYGENVNLNDLMQAVFAVVETGDGNYEVIKDRCSNSGLRLTPEELKIRIGLIS